ncbi:hypothetical protein CDCA_CDCA10G2895 [Cyanidium caldarium]|uniref:Uncharacterized protein n=1 Tax=Cyanidium caldarium TaxID=2771 RepID=A0AAV9IX12_CYACA|nr:hypothetical protein CDCA_CDCA10G2895 [Cyanidium caldarium]
MVWQPRRRSRLSSSTRPSARSAPLRRLHLVADRSPKRKRWPVAYWHNFENLAREIYDFCEENGIAWERRMPSQSELEKMPHPRPYLSNAIRLHGGWLAVADRLGLQLTSIARPQSLYLTFAVKMRSTRMAPPNYWRDWNNVSREVLDFVRTRGKSFHHMPTAQELEENNRSDLVRAISKHGGFHAVARVLGLLTRACPRGYWDDFPHVHQEILQAAKHAGVAPGVMPTLRQLSMYGATGLPQAIARHGGVAAVAPRLHLRPQRHIRARRKPLGYWTQHTVDAEMRAIVQQYGRMPTKQFLNDIGRRDLEHAAQKFGGLTAAAQRIGVPAARPQHLPDTSGDEMQPADALDHDATLLPK